MSHSAQRARTMAVAILAVAAGGCAGNAALASAPGKHLTGAEIAAAMTAANQGEVEEGQLASQKSSTPSVRDLAQRIVTDHTASNERIAALVQSAGISPKENELSRSLLQDHQAAMDSLRARAGAEFDRAYLQRQVVAHRYLLSLLDNVFLPSAQSPEMKAQLTADRAAVAMHLQAALQALAATTTTGATRAPGPRVYGVDVSTPAP